MAREKPGSSGMGDIEQLAQNSEPAKSAWQQTVQDMRAMAADREDRGYEVLTTPAGHTSPIAPADGDTDDFGLSFIVPDDKGDRFAELYEECSFGETGVYQKISNGHVYIVMEYADMDASVVVYVAGVYEMRHAPELVRAATSRDVMNSFVKRLDHNVLGRFEHGDVSAFFPNPDDFYAYEMQQ